jgi:hypothetical protein
MFDGAKYESARKGGNLCCTGGGARGGVDTATRRFRLDPPPPSGAASDRGRVPIEIEITTDGDSADDALIRAVSGGGGDDVGEGGVPAPDAARRGGRTISLEEVIDILSGGDDDDHAETDALPYYVVVQRKPGGTRTHRRLFGKLHLRRPDEGVVCLSSLMAGLRRGSLRIARELRREKSIDRVIECERSWS